MTRFLALLSAFLVLIGLTACGQKNDKDNKYTVDLQYYADLGQIPECEYKLGDSAEEIKGAFEAAASENEENLFNFDEGEETTLIDNGVYNFYYKNKKVADGISYIVSYDTAFGFEIGAISIEVAKAINAEYTEEELSPDNAFFVWGVENGKVLKYEFDDTTVLFVFNDNALCATAIYNSNWE